MYCRNITLNWLERFQYLYINILFNMLYLCIQQTQTVQCRQTLCIYVCKISRTYQQSMIHIAYDMQFIYATLFPCNRWSNCQINVQNQSTDNGDLPSPLKIRNTEKTQKWSIVQRLLLITINDVTHDLNGTEQTRTSERGRNKRTY